MDRCADMFMSMFMDTLILSITCWMRVHLGTVYRVHACPRMFTKRVHVRCHADKFRLVNHAIRRGAETPMVDELVEGGARDAQLTRRVEFGKLGHGWALGSKHGLFPGALIRHELPPDTVHSEIEAFEHDGPEQDRLAHDDRTDLKGPPQDFDGDRFRLIVDAIAAIRHR